MALTQHPCRHCGLREGTSFCTGCRKVSYCSKECQLTSWKQGHRFLCGNDMFSKAICPIPPIQSPSMNSTDPRKKDPWGLSSQCLMVLDRRFLTHPQDYYFAIPAQHVPRLEMETASTHVSARVAPIDFQHSAREILCEITILGATGPVRLKAIVPTPPEWLEANSRSCNLGPPEKASEELCNRLAVGIQNSFAEQIFTYPQMWICGNPKCYRTGTPGPRIAVIGSRLVHRVRKPVLQDIWTPTCYDQRCIDHMRNTLTGSMIKFG